MPAPRRRLRAQWITTTTFIRSTKFAYAPTDSGVPKRHACIGTTLSDQQIGTSWPTSRDDGRRVRAKRRRTFQESVETNPRRSVTASRRKDSTRMTMTGLGFTHSSCCVRRVALCSSAAVEAACSHLATMWGHRLCTRIDLRSERAARFSPAAQFSGERCLVVLLIPRVSRLPRGGCHSHDSRRVTAL